MFNKILDVIYNDSIWNVLLVVALFAFAINLIVGVL